MILDFLELCVMTTIKSISMNKMVINKTIKIQLKNQLNRLNNKKSKVIVQQVLQNEEEEEWLEWELGISKFKAKARINSMK